MANEENRKHGWSGVAHPGAVSERVDVSAGTEITAPGLLSMTPLASVPTYGAPKLSKELRSDLSKLTPALAKGVRDVAKRR